MSITTATSRGISGLQLDTRAESTKYWGEVGDRHFIPDSPLISRQRLAVWQEEELTRSCTLLLQGVPHSDDSAANEFLHLASHIIAGSRKTRRPTLKSVSDKSPAAHRHATVGGAAGAPPTVPSTSKACSKPGLSNDSTTPSTISRRDVFDKTDTSTPMTSTGITPQEFTARSADKAPSSSTDHAGYFPSSSKQIQSLPTATKSLTSLPTTAKWVLKEVPPTKPRKSRRKPLFDKPEYNKSLPDVPALSHVYHTDDADDLSGPSFELVRETRPPRRYRTPTEQPDRIHADETKVSKFSLRSLFGKKSKQHTKQMSLS